ncbi:MAG: VanW family protein [Actinomycetota bacterium]
MSTQYRRPAVAIVSFCVLVGMWTGTAAIASAGKVVGGTVLGGVPVEGLQAQELSRRLGPAAQAVQRRPLTLSVDDRQWTRTPESIGITVDLRASVGRALQVGRTSSFSWVFESFFDRRKELDWVPHIDQDRLDAAVAELAALADRDASNGDFRVVGSSVEVQPPTEGVSLIPDEIKRALVEAVVSPHPGDVVELPAQVTSPDITPEQQARVQHQAEEVLSGPIEFLHEGRSFTVPAEKVAPSLRVEVTERSGGESGSIALAADPETLNAAIVDEAPFVRTAPKDATFTVSGSNAYLQPDVDGSSIDAGPPAAELVKLTSSNRPAIELPTVVEPADLTTEEASALQIKQRIASFTTAFDARNAPRVGNIDRMASAIDGTILLPGETFSLNGTTGDRSVVNGYQEAGVLVDGEVVPGIGGGVCQVATTLFNAVYSAGLDVVDRSNHSLFISSYPTGKDAMINYGYQDLRFNNDTSFGMLLKASVSAKDLTVSIYSSPLGRRVEESVSPRSNPRTPELKVVEDPSLPEGTEIVTAEGIDGFDVTVTRTVYEGGNVVHKDNFVSKYKPWKRVVKVGTGPPLPPEPAPDDPDQVASEDPTETDPGGEEASPPAQEEDPQPDGETAGPESD